MDRTAEDLTAWARRAARGDDLAMEEFLTRIHPILARYLLRYLGDEGDVASDLAQEALVRIASSLCQSRAQTQEQLIAWCLVIARNVSIDFLRASQREPSHHGSTLDGGHPLVGGETAMVPAPEFSVLFGLLRDAEAEVSDDSRRILYLRLVENASWAAVGEELGIAESAAKRRFQRAQRRIRREVLIRVNQLGTSLRQRVLDRIRRFGE